jgi:hypothetical protein
MRNCYKIQKCSSNLEVFHTFYRLMNCLIIYTFQTPTNALVHFCGTALSILDIIDDYQCIWIFVRVVVLNSRSMHPGLCFSYCHYFNLKPVYTVRHKKKKTNPIVQEPGGEGERQTDGRGACSDLSQHYKAQLDCFTQYMCMHIEIQTCSYPRSENVGPQRWTTS